MTTIVTPEVGATAKGSPLTNAEIDANFTNLNTDKSEKSANLSDLTDVSQARANLGLGAVNNTADIDKPISTAQQAALDLKADLASPALTGTPTAPTAAAGTNTTQIATTAFVAEAVSGFQGTGAIDAFLTNEGHIFPADSDGNVLTYTTAGTMLTVFEGAQRLLYDGVGTAPGTWKYTLQSNNITPGLVNILDGGLRLTFETPSGVSPTIDSSAITFNINGTSTGGVPFFLNPKQTLVKARHGAAGQNGQDGQDGSPGASAYQVAVAGGFVGTEAQWLASLAGQKGDKGDKGDQGDPGPAGTMTYPSAGLAVSTGTGWGGSKTAPAGALVGTTDTQTISNKTLDNYTEKVFSVSGTTPALSPVNGPIQAWTLSGSSIPTAGTWAEGQSITLMVDDGSAGTINWSSVGVTWKTNGGTAPTLNTTGYTVIALWKVGSTIYGARVGDA